jgi:hypothetical protein
MTAALGWLIWPAAFHQIAVKGRMTAGLHAFTSKVLDWALLPIALGLALTQYTVASALDLRFAAAIGAGAGAFALCIWYAWSLAGRPRDSKRKVHQQLSQQEQKQRGEPDLSGPHQESAAGMPHGAARRAGIPGLSVCHRLRSGL